MDMHQHQGTAGSAGMPSQASPTTSASPNDTNNNGMASNANTGILHTQLSWGPRPGLHHQFRSVDGMSGAPSSNGGFQQQQPGSAQPAMGFYPTASNMGVGVNGMQGGRPMSSHSQSHLLHEGQQAGGNIFDTNWAAMPTLHTARDFAINFQSSTGLWQPPVGHAPVGPEIRPSGCLVEAAQNAADASLRNDKNNGVGHPPLELHGRNSLPGPGPSNMGVPTSYGLPRHSLVIPHPNMMPHHQIPSPHIPPTPALSGSFSHSIPNTHPHTPMTAGSNPGMFSPVDSQTGPGSVDSAYIEAFLGGAPSSVAHRRHSTREDSMISGANALMDGGPGSGTRPSTMMSSSSMLSNNNNNHAIHPNGMVFDNMASPPPTSESAMTLGAALANPAFAPPPTSNSLMTEPDMMSNYLSSSTDNRGLDTHMFTPLGDAFGAMRPTSSSSAHPSVTSSSMGSGSSALATPGGLIATTQIAGSQLSMTDPFHAVSLELWRQLGYSSSQTYGMPGANGARGQGGAMILEDDGMLGMNSAHDGGLDSAISLNAEGGMNDFGPIGAGSLVLNQMQKSGTSPIFGFNPGMSPTAENTTNAGPASGSGSAGVGTLHQQHQQNRSQGEEEAEDEDMLASEEEDNDDDDEEDGETLDPLVRAARLRAKQYQLHRRQGVTCDQCRSKHLRCDLSDRKFRAFEATLQHSLGLSDLSDPTAMARSEAAMAVQAEDEAKLDAAAAAKAATSGTPVVLNNPIRCTRCEKRGMICTKSYNPPSKRHPRPSRTGKRIEQARQLHGTRPMGESAEAPLTMRELALENIYNLLTGEEDLSESHSTDARLYNRILASSINIRLLTTYFAVFHIQMPVIDFDNFCYRFNFANGDTRKMAIMANGGDEDEDLPSAAPHHRNIVMSDSTDPRDSTISTTGTVEALMAAMHLCAALYTDMPLVQPVNSKKLFRSTSNRVIRPMPNRGERTGAETVNSFILPHPKGSKQDQQTEQAIEIAAAEAAGKRSNKRLKRKQGVACDSCRLRRVRCDLTERPKGASCTRCEDKKINCTADYIESIRAKGKTVVLDVVHAKQEAAQKNRAKDREISKERMAAAAAAAAAAAVVSGNGSEGGAGGSKDGGAGGPSSSSAMSSSRDAAAIAAAATAVAAAAQEEEEEDEKEEEYDSDEERAWERAQERWVRSGANGKEFGQLKISDGPPGDATSSTLKRAIRDGGEEEYGAEGAVQTQRTTSRDVDMGSWGRVSPQVPDTISLVHQNDMLQWGRARQGFFTKLKDRAIELVYRHDLLHRPSSEAIQTLMILCHILYAVDPVQVKLFASVALKHIQALNLQTRHEVYEQDQEAVEHLLADMQASRVYLTSWTRDGIMSGMYRSEPNFPEERTIQVKGGQRPFDPSDQLKTASVGGASQPGQSSGAKELSGQMGLTFSIMAMTQIGALSRFVAKHIDRTEGLPAGASATDRFPLLPTAGDMKKLVRACNAVWQGTDALLQFFDKCAARSRENMDRLKPFQPLPWIAMLKMCGAMLDLAVYRVLSERYGVNAAYMAAVTRQMQMSNGTAVNPKVKALSDEDFEQAKVLRGLFEKGRIRAMIRSRRTAHLAAFLLRKNVFQFGGVIMRQFFAVSQFLARMPCEDPRMAGTANEETRSGVITTLENTPTASMRGSRSPETSRSAAMSPPSTTPAASTSASKGGPSSQAGSVAAGTPASGASPAASTTKASASMAIQGRAASPSTSFPNSLTRTESSVSGRTTASVEGEGHVPWYVGARELGPFDQAAKKREVGWCLEAMAQIGYAWSDMELKIASVESIMRSEGLFP
ncbi:hypothetical protein CF327_g5230 [Tilletia walkeri]|uniref:Zn(2)-C6 fungal-type domain-containing protein n=1 Tax=Tilletia walkeri TaxID=117179 RepID=A0A8X7NA05_9BASI|nr:hypothetical protein CF327_g5230 [Tilletia walkeri]KAE8268550.1 hypothetical protein A4X09_0g3799 [Tilletia walkeri]